MRFTTVLPILVAIAWFARLGIYATDEKSPIARGASHLPTVTMTAAKGAAGSSLTPVRSHVSNRVYEDVRKLHTLEASPEGSRILNPAHGDANQQVVDSRNRPSELGRMVRTARAISELMSDCLEHDLCGQGPEGGYFDPENTPGHLILNKALQFLIAARNFSDIRGEGDPTDEELFNLLRIHNTETQILSLEILLNRPVTEELRSSLLARAPLIQDEAKPQYFEAMQRLTESSPLAHRQFLNALYESFRHDDVGTIAKTVDNLGRIKLSQDEFQQAVSNLCHIRADPQTHRSWGTISYGLIRYGETRAISADPDGLCS